MRKFLLVSALSIVALTSANIAFAGGHGGGGGHEVAPTSGKMSPASNAGAVNGNGSKALDRDTGLARAEDRRNSHSMVKRHQRKTHHRK